MPDYSEVYLCTDQPATCPQCGARSEIIMDLSHTQEASQVHACLDEKCEYEFIVQDEDIQNIII